MGRCANTAAYVGSTMSFPGARVTSFSLAYNIVESDLDAHLQILISSVMSSV